ncbi:MAG: endonuclease III [Candidatus Micrarchaeales archaeon]|jgi:endonuclease-3
MKEFRLISREEGKRVVEMLEHEYHDASYYLKFNTSLELLVAAILSAQTRDEIVNSSTPELFKHFRKASDFANAKEDEIMKYVSRISFAGNKIKNIIKTCKIIDEKYGGEVPRKMEDLVELPGIGRKTANTILINAYGIVEGIPVDTWVIKLSDRLGLSESAKPEEIEKDLMAIVERKFWKNFAYVLKTHGKKICQSQVPLCSKCLIGPNNKSMCPRNGVTKSA